MEIFKSNKSYNFMGRRLPFMGFSALLVIASFVLLFTKGLNLGIDFSGGTLVQVQYTKAAPIKDIREILNSDIRFEKSTVTEFGRVEEIIIKIPSTSTSIEKDIGDDVRSILKPTGDFEVRRVDIVGPKVGDALQEKGIQSTYFPMPNYFHSDVRFNKDIYIKKIEAFMDNIVFTK